MIKRIEKIFKALGDRSRLRIINMLGQRSMCVCEITEVLRLSQSTVSGHLKILKDAEIVDDKKDGLWVEYHLCITDGFTAGILEGILDYLKLDTEMEKERQEARQADRERICKR